MKILLFMLFLTVPFCVKSQILVEGKDINADSTLQYIEIVGADIGLFKKKLVVGVDFGQKMSLFDGKDTAIKDKEGKTTIFNTMIDALNFFARNGWAYRDAYTVSVPNSGQVYHFLLTRLPSAQATLADQK